MNLGEKTVAILIAVSIVTSALAMVIVATVANTADSSSGQEDLARQANLPPTAGAVALTTTIIEAGGYVVLESTSVDSDGTIVDYTWHFGDFSSASGEFLTTVNHTYQYGGSYQVQLVVRDDDGAVASNEDSMVRIYVQYWDPMNVWPWDNTTAPYAQLFSDRDVAANNTMITFNMTGSYGIEWIDVMTGFVSGWDHINWMSLDFGDNSTPAMTTPAEYMTATHIYPGPGHYAARLTVMGGNGASINVTRTIHILSPGAQSPGSVKNPDAFIKATIGEPDYLDPAVDYETTGGEVLQNVYETLIWYDRDSVVTLKPMLATAIPSFANGGISADGLNYTFNLRAGVQFHDGTIMTADDVVYSIQRALRIHDPGGPSWMLEQVMTDYISYYVGEELQYFPSSTQWLLDALGGTAPTYVITERDVQNVSEAAVLRVDSDTVTFRLTHPYPAFLQIVASTVMSIVSMDYVESNGGITNGEHNSFMDQHTCGTGPYRLVSWEFGSSIHLTRFDDYWGEAPALKDVYVVKANDVITRIMMLQAGDVDTAYIPIQYENLFQSTDFDVIKGLPTFEVTFTGFNHNINAAQAAVFGSTVPADFFADRNIRQAFVHLFNASQFIQNVLRGNAIQPNGPVPKGMFGYNASAPTYEYNLTLAQQYFEAAPSTTPGQSWWDVGFTVAFIYNAGNVYRETACQYIESALEGLGSRFHAELHALDWPTYLSLMRASPSPLPMFYLGWGPDYADPDDYVNPFLYTYGSFPYRTGYSNATIDALIEAAASEPNPVLREQMYHEIVQLCYDDAPYIWLYQANSFHVQRSWVNGYYHNPMYGGQYFAALSKDVPGNAPAFIVTPPDPIYSASGEEVNLSILVRDLDNDNINVTWNWGDGTSESTNSTGLASLGEWVNQIHTWTVPSVPGHGDYFEVYNITVTLRDGTGFVTTWYGTVEVYVGPNMPPTLAMSLSATIVEPGENFNVTTSAADAEGDPLTWTLYVSNGTSTSIVDVRTTNSSAPDELVWNNVTLSLMDEGDYWITVNVSDASPPYQVWPHNLSVSQSLLVVQNSGPMASSAILITPASPVIDIAVGEVTADFSIDVFDMDGDNITATWYLGEDYGPLTNTTAGGTIIYSLHQTRTFNSTGTYNISVVISDGHTGVDIVRSTLLTVTSSNLPPLLADIYIAHSQVVSSLPNESINITLVFTDAEEDVIEVTIDFGDGTGLQYFNVSVYSGGTASLVVNHSYELVGTYNMTVNYTDDQMGVGDHTGEATADVVISDVLIPEFSLLLLPVLGIALLVLLARRRRNRW